MRLARGLLARRARRARKKDEQTDERTWTETPAAACASALLQVRACVPAIYHAHARARSSDCGMARAIGRVIS